MKIYQRRIRILGLLTASLLLVTPMRADEPAATDPQIGDPAARVRELLGEPRGSIRSGTVEMMQYDRGRVVIREGVVAELELVSEEVATAQKLERARQAEDLQRARDLWREQQRVAGIEIRDRAVNSPEFQSSSGTRQVEFWTSFRRRYPDVPVDPEYTAALARRDSESAKAETDRRLASMELRVAEADARARQAEADAKQAERNNRRRYVYYAPPYGGHYTYPVCPPTSSVPRTSTPYIGGSYTYGTFGSPYVQRPSSIPTPASGMTIRLSY